MWYNITNLQFQNKYYKCRSDGLKLKVPTVRVSIHVTVLTCPSKHIAVPKSHVDVHYKFKSKIGTISLPTFST